MDVLIIGGIAAGMSTAMKARRENVDANITVIEKEDYVSFGACGLSYYLGNQFEDENELFARTPQQIKDAGVHLLTRHEVIAVDLNLKTATIKNLETDERFTKSYDKIMIATGAKAVISDLQGVDADNVYTITRLKDVKKMKERLNQYENIVIIGGGFIGIETAEQLAQLNKKVHIVLSSGELMRRIYDVEVTDKLKEALEDMGVQVNLNTNAKQLVVKDNNVVEVITDQQSIKADAVVIAIGFTPVTDLFKGQLEMLENGAIITDSYGQTSIEGVFSAGDCASVKHKFTGDKWIPQATYANKMGRLIGTNIVKDKKDWIAFGGALGSSLIKIGEMDAGITGVNEKEALSLNMNIATTTVYTNNHSNYIPNQEKIMIKLVYDKETFVLYGAQVFGKEAGLRLHALTVAVSAGVTTKELGFMDFAYAPPYNSTWEAINVAANTAK